MLHGFDKDSTEGRPASLAGTWGEWALYSASPLRSLMSELGVQAPVSFRDPLGSRPTTTKCITRRRAMI